MKHASNNKNNPHFIFKTDVIIFFGEGVGWLWTRRGVISHYVLYLCNKVMFSLLIILFARFNPFRAYGMRLGYLQEVEDIVIYRCNKEGFYIFVNEGYIFMTLLRM